MPHLPPAAKPLLATLMATLLACAPPAARADAPQPAHEHAPSRELLAAGPGAGRYVFRAAGGSLTCGDPTVEEALAMDQRDLSSLQLISAERPAKRAGLTILLRGTPQLESFPAAKQAFLRAAAGWQAVISSPITLVLDVDFGPTRFGVAYPENVLGSTDSQIVGGTTNYGAVRSSLLSSAASPAETAVYNALPASAVPTDLGPTSGVFTASSVFRARCSPPVGPTARAATASSPATGRTTFRRGCSLASWTRRSIRGRWRRLRATSCSL